MKRLLSGFTVLLFHTAAANAQQSPPAGEVLPEDLSEAPPLAAPAPTPPPPPVPPVVAPPVAQPTPPTPPAPAPPPPVYQQQPPQYAQPRPYAPPPAYPAPRAYPQPRQYPAYPGPNYAAPSYASPSYPPPGYAPPPGYGPPPGYVPPPPPSYPPQSYGPPRRYYQHYYPAPQPLPVRSVTDRPFTIGGGGGFGGLQFRDTTGTSQSKPGGAYTFRLGFGLAPGVILMWDVEGAVSGDDWQSSQQTAHLAALQLFLTNRLFLKGGIGAAHVDQVSGPQVWEGRWGGAAMGGIGYELIQGYHWSFDVEATVTGAHYAKTDDMPVQNATNWSLVNFAINFF